MDKKPTNPNPKDRAATSRLDLSLFPATARAYGALALTEGDCKYGGYNWRDASACASVYYSAASRHLEKWYNGEECDDKTGVPHLASALASIAVLIDASECGKLTDDRPPVAPVQEMLARMEYLVARLHTLFPEGPVRHTEAGKSIAP